MSRKGVILSLVLVGLICLIPKQIDFRNQKEHPVMNLPHSLRQRNWVAGRGWNGSCVVASMVSLLRWQGKPKMASYLRSKYGGGQDYYGWRATLDSEGIIYASTYRSNNVAFLEKAVATRRGCMVGVAPYEKENAPKHMVCLVDLTSTRACILDNNQTDAYIWVDRDDFLAEWESSGSWALTPVYTPTSPRIPK